MPRHFTLDEATALLPTIRPILEQIISLRARLERTEREQEEKLTKLVKALKLQKGDIVADIGAGSGVLSFQMAKQVGDDGKVLAVDVQQEMLDRLERRMKSKKLTNVETILSTEKSPKLPPESVDLAIMVDVYHEFSEPQKMVSGFRTAVTTPNGVDSRPCTSRFSPSSSISPLRTRQCRTWEARSPRDRPPRS